MMDFGIGIFKTVKFIAVAGWPKQIAKKFKGNKAK